MKTTELNQNNIDDKGFVSNVALRQIMLCVIAVDLIMAIIATFMYRPLLTMPHFYLYILELGIMFPVYIVILVLGTRPSADIAILRISTFFGIIAALLEIFHISIENFGHLNARAETVSTGIFMGGLFLLFALSGLKIALKKHSVVSGMLGAGWTSVVCMLIVMTFGLSQLFWSFAAIEAHDIGNPDFIRTGWNDMHAFVIADIFEACFKILIMGPIIGIILGSLSGVIARLLLNRKVN